MSSSIRRGVRLPKAIRDELNLGAPSSSQRSFRKATRPDRKSIRKQRRLESKAPRHRKQPERDHVDIESDESGDEGPASEVKVNDRVSRAVATPSPEPASVTRSTSHKRKRPKVSGNELEINAARRPGNEVMKKLAEDDAEIRRLEKRLKLKTKSPLSAFKRDGLDYLLDDLKDDYLDFGPEAGVPARGQRSKGSNMKEGIERATGHRDIKVSGSPSDDLYHAVSDGHDDTSSDDHLSDEFHGFSEEEGSVDSGIAEAPEVLEPTRTLPESAKYIPPSLRKPVTPAAEHMSGLRRRAQGILNRLSEAKLISLLNDVEELYRTYPRGDVTGILTDIMIGTISSGSSVLDTFMVLHGGFTAGVYKLVGTDFGAHIVQRVVEQFLFQRQKAQQPGGMDSLGKETTNLISFLAELYNFQVVSCVLIFDLIRLFLSELNELHTELLLKLVRISGPQLRTDDPGSLKSLVLLLQPAIEKAGGLSKLSTRTKFMIESISNLKNNRLKSTDSSAVTAEATVRMRKILGSLNTRGLRATEPLRPSLDDIINISSKGKWWLVGASWVGVGDSAKQSSSGQTPPSIATDRDLETSDSEVDTVPDLHELALQHRINTDIRRAIFVTLLSATDCADAHTRLLKLRLKKSQEQEITRVLLHCCVAEADYNPYYTLIAKKLCTDSHQQRMTFQFALWEYFRRFGEEDERGTLDDADDETDTSEFSVQSASGLRKLVNLGRLFGSLVASRCLQLTILKTLKWPYLQPPTKCFLDVFFMTAVEGGAGIFQAAADNLPLLKGILWFLKKSKRRKGGIEEVAETLASIVDSSA